MSPRPSPRQVPLFIGAAVLLVSAAVALWPRSTPAPGAGAPSAGVAPSELGSVTPPAPSPEATAEGYEPDLSGPDLGEVVVASAAMAHGLGVVGDRLVWLLTEGATLGSARLDGGDAVVVFASDDPEAFGGSMANSHEAVWWSVDKEGDDPESIFQARLEELQSPLKAPTPVAQGTSPDHLAVVGGALVWSDLGRLWRYAGGDAELVATRDRRVVTLFGAPDAVFFIEAPYQGGGKAQLSRVAVGGAEPVVLTSVEAGDHDLLAALHETLFWAESSEAGHVLRALDPGAPLPRRVAATGVVTALTVMGAEVVWAEAHGDENDPTTLLRAVRAAPEARPRRLGRVSGHVTALVAGPGHLFWSGKRGIERHAPAPLPEQDAP